MEASCYHAIKNKLLFTEDGVKMKVIEVADRTPLLIKQLLEVWESSVRATHLFLSENEIENIKKYVPQALNEVPHLLVLTMKINVPLALWELQNNTWKCFSLRTRKGGKGLERRCFNTESSNIPSMIWR